MEPEGIKAELWKHEGDKVIQMLTKMFQKIEHHSIRKEYVAFVIKLKKEDKKKCDNYRGLGVIPTIARNFERVIRKKYRKEHKYIYNIN